MFIKNIVRFLITSYTIVQVFPSAFFFDRNFNKTSDHDLISNYSLKIGELPANNECEHKTNLLLSSIFNKTQLVENQLDMYKFIIYSGTSLNDIGDYFGCKKLKISKFYTYWIYITNPQKITLKQGICYFKECDKSYLQNSLFKFINLISENYTSASQLNQEMIKIHDTDFMIQEYKDKNRTGMIVSLTIFCLIILFHILHFFIMSSNKHDKFVHDIEEQNLVVSRRVANQNYWYINFLSFFDFQKNSSRILKIHITSKTSQALKILDGVRVLSTCWVILGHTFSITQTFGEFKNFIDLLDLEKTLKMCIVESGFFAVDSFFFMSAFLLFISFQPYLNKQISKVKTFFLLLLNRYIRLLPLYLFILFGVTFILPFLSSGPIWEMAEGMNETCLKFSWHNLFYINNLMTYTEKDHICALHTWYLANDMQFFIFSILVFVLFNKHRFIRNSIFLITFCANCIFSVIFTYQKKYGYTDPFTANDPFFQDFYIRPYMRVCTYLMGIFFGELFIQTPVYEKETKVHINTERNWIRSVNLWIIKSNLATYTIFIISLLLINFSIFTPYFINNNKLETGYHAFLITFSKIFFVFGLGCIIHLSLLGKISFITNFLRINFFSQVGKITYGMYLFHIYFIILFVCSYSSIQYVKMGDFIFLALGYIIMSGITSFFMSILLESPFINITKKLLKSGSKI
jgi:peptidoglycan/LPS O-acetylase OafA/YrhL